MKVGEALARDPHEGVRSSVAFRDDLTTSVLHVLAQDVDPAIRTRVARHRDTAVADRDSLQEDPDPRVRHAAQATMLLAADNAAQIKALVTADVGLRQACAEEAALSQEALRLLSEDKDDLVRARVAANRSAPPEVLARLAQDRLEIRRAVAGNPCAPADAIALLEAETDPAVQQALGRQQLTTAPCLGRLAVSLNNEVRCAAARNPRTPAKTLAALLSLPNESAYRLVLQNRGLMLENLVIDNAERAQDPVVAARWARFWIMVRLSLALIVFGALNFTTWRPVEGAVSVLIPAISSVAIGYGLWKLIGVFSRLLKSSFLAAWFGEFASVAVTFPLTIFFLALTVLSGRVLLEMISGDALGALAAATSAAGYIAECVTAYPVILGAPWIVACILYSLSERVGWKLLETSLLVLATLGFFFGMAVFWYAGRHTDQTLRFIDSFAPLLPLQPTEPDWVYWLRK